MVKQIVSVAVISSAFILAGCQNTAFGVSQKKFAAMSAKQQSKTIAQYNAERKKQILELPLHKVAGSEHIDKMG